MQNVTINTECVPINTECEFNVNVIYKELRFYYVTNMCTFE